VAAAEAVRAGSDVIDIEPRDADVALSERGGEQARAVGRYLATIPEPQRPAVAFCSPYLRTRQTASLALEALGAESMPLDLDERIRDRELGILDRLTQQGIDHLHPDQAAARRRLGKFYHRPPGGESWADVALRLRSFIDTLRTDHASERLVIFTHDIVVMLFRYLLEGLDEPSLLQLARRTRVVNGGVTSYELHQSKGLILRRFNAVITPDGQTVPDSQTVDERRANDA
jgi:broad specificity phosphatase PhoE